jgi:hypothetical protein
MSSNDPPKVPPGSRWFFSFCPVYYKNMADKLLKVSLLLIFVIALIHFLALNFYLYWQIWWLDIVTHFLGGIWAVSFALWLLLFSGLWKEAGGNIYLPLFLAFLLSLVAAVGWEFYEFKQGMTFTHFREYWPDTISDVLATLVGAGLASFFLLHKIILKKNR